MLVQVTNIEMRVGEETIDANDMRAGFQQSVAQMRVGKPGAAGHQYASLEMRVGRRPSVASSGYIIIKIHDMM